MNFNLYAVNKAKAARKAAGQIYSAPTKQKNMFLKNASKLILKNSSFIKKENQKDIKNAKKNKLSSSLIDRLVLNDKRIKEIALSLREIKELKDPVGSSEKTYTRDSGIKISKVRVPIGVIMIIYESRPNVTADAAALCLKAGNSVILRGGREAFFSNKCLVSILKDALKKSGLNEDIITFIDNPDRSIVTKILKRNNYIDLVIPRGGEGLIKAVEKASRIPVIKHYKGVCHIYVNEIYDMDKALLVCLNAKVQRPGVCNAMETLLVDEKCAGVFLPRIYSLYKKHNVEIRGCAKTIKILQAEKIKKASEKDYYEEYLDLILSVKVVKGVFEAVNHIKKYGSGHSDGIISNNLKDTEYFVNNVDSSSVFVNASTRFADGGQYGLGAEIGISTDKLHARGPMGIEDLTSYKYVVYGNGSVRK